MSDELEALRARVTALEAVEAIRRLKYAYFRACDRQLPDDVRACFTENGATIDYEAFPLFTDRDSFAEIFRQMGCRPNIVDMHHGQNPEIDVQSETRASGVWAMYYFNIDLEARTAVQLAGHYADLYECVDTKWLIRSTIFRRTSLATYRIAANGEVFNTGMGRNNNALGPVL